LQSWIDFEIRDGILYRSTLIDGSNVRQLVLPFQLKEIAFRGIHNDASYQGRDKTLWLAKHRFYWEWKG
jgi:hypothetical protein